MPLKYYNSAPYYDDFDETKNYLRILFRPGFAVQARELTQMQTALQAQIDRHGRYVFKEGTPVIGGNITTDSSLDYVKIQSTFNAVIGGILNITDNYYEEFVGTTITGVTTGVTATVVWAEPSIDDDPITLFVKYTNSGNNGITKTFAPNEEINSDAIVSRKGKVLPIASTPIGKGYRFNIDSGVFFINGNFVYSPSENLILSKYTTNPSIRVIYNIEENIVTNSEDITLTDNSIGTSNVAAPGAHRYQISLTIGTAPFSFTEVRDGKIIQLAVIENGVVKKIASTENSILGDTLAVRTFEESGNYSVRPFLINIREMYDNGSNNGVHSVAQLRDKFSLSEIDYTDNEVIVYGESYLAVGLEKSVAYVNGYRIAIDDIKYIELLKARDTANFNLANIIANVGNYIYVNVTSSLPDIDNYSTMILKDVSNAQIGTARARSISWVSGTLYKLYLFDIIINSTKSFESVTNITQSYSGAAQFEATTADINGNSANADRFNTNNNSLVFPLPFNTVKSLIVNGQNDTTYVVKKTFYSQSYTGNATTITITDGVFQSYNPADWIITIASGTNAGDPLGITDVSLIFNVSNGTSTAVITNDSSDTSSATGGLINIIAPIKKNLSRKNKTLVTNAQIYNFVGPTSPGDFSSLGFTDILSITSIKDIGVSIGGGEYLDVTDRYELDNGQRDNFYGIGKIILKQGKSAPIGNINIKVNYFQHSSGDYFSVDSYSSIDYALIPSFNSSKGLIQLRDAIDFRPTKDSTGSNFTGQYSSSPDMIVPGSVIETDLTYYLNRTDKVYVDKYGTFGIVEGVPALNPEMPRDVQDSMTLYELRVGSYTFGPQSIQPKMIDNKRYTMRDIGRLEGRLKNLEYYTSLSLLEKDTANYQIDLQHFKNGFIVDNFYGHNVGYPSHPDYSVSMDKSLGIMRPQFTENEVRLKLFTSSSSNVVKTGSLLTLDYDEVDYIEQPYASYPEFVNPYNVFTWRGDMQLSPESDNWKDTENRPEVIIDQEGIYDAFKDLADATGVTGTVWNEWQTNWSGSTAERSSGGTNWVFRELIETTNVITTTTSSQSRDGIRTEVVPDTITNNLGDRVVEINFIPFMRSRIVSFEAKMMKPNTKVYAFFDGKNITPYTTQTTQFWSFTDFTNANPSYTSAYTFNNETSWPASIGLAASAELITNASGTISGLFIIPNNDQLRFRTGSRVFQLTDSIDNITSDSTTSAEAVYEAAGLLESQENVILSTRVPKFDRTALNSNQIVVDIVRSSTQRVIGWREPLAQTFMVDAPGGIFATSIDLYFQQVDENIPVTLHIVTTLVGQPSTTILPFSNVTKILNVNNISEDASVATKFTFQAPVHLQQGVEYAIVIISMSDKPKVWVSEMGEFDVSTPAYRISKQPYLGVFFKSQNASTWTPEQEKDLKFKLNRANFVTQGVAAFHNVDVQPKKLAPDSIETINGSTKLRVYSKNHGLFNGSYVTISGVAPNASLVVNGIPIVEINKELLIERVEKDFFIVNSETVANSDGRVGGTAVYFNRNILMNNMQLSSQQLVLPDTNINWTASTATGTSLPGSEQAYVVSSPFNVIANQNTYFNRIQCVPSTDNQLAGPGFTATATLVGNSYLSPIIDLDRMSIFAIANLIDNPSDTSNIDNTNYVENFVSELEPNGGSAICKYITRRISLDSQANQIRVLANVNRPSSTYIELYYKVSTSSDSNFDTLPWILHQPDEAIIVDENPNKYREIEYTIDQIGDDISTSQLFSSMAFKIVLKSTNSSFVPKCKDFRAIAIYV